MNTIIQADEINQAVRGMAEKIKARHGDKPLAIIGIRSRGDVVAERICNILIEDEREIFFGTLDISLYRDDYEHLRENPLLQATEIDFPVDDAVIILVDDVLFTGRTIRAALDALADYGRPAKVELAVLVDRGHREMPIMADFVGILLETDRRDHVIVSLEGVDGLDQIEIIKN